MRKWKMSKLFSIFLACILCLSFMPTNVMATENDSTVKNGYYNDYDNWVEGELNQDLPEGIHSVNKTAVKTGDNTYNITLEVVTEQNLSTITKKSATILVIDTSGSMSDSQRLTNAKRTAKEFVKTYAGENPDSGRYLAIVDFATVSNVALEWTDVSSVQGKYKANTAIDSLRANGGTNLHAGLKQANQLFNDAKVQNIEIDSRNTIVLTDGAPTYYLQKCEKRLCFEKHVTISNVKYDVMGSGSYGSKTINENTVKEAETLKGKSAIHTICYGAKNMETYRNGPLVSTYLRDSIASETKNAYNADNADELVKAFKAITETITSGLDGKGLSLFDGSAPFVSVSGLPESIQQTTDGFTWTLKDATTSTEGNKTYYTYKLTYTVTLDADNTEFVEGEWYPLNGKTYITILDGEKVYFPIPAGQGMKTRYTVTYTDGVENEELFEDQITTNLVYGDKTPDFNGTPERIGYFFDGWTPQKNDTVTGSITYTATWVKKTEVLNVIPTINANDKTLTVGDTFDPLDGVLANDKEDGDLTVKVEVLSNSVDTSTAGTYEVTYKVTDSQGASATKTISVVVNPKMEKLNEVPSISASDKTLTVGDTFDLLDGVLANDKEDGDLTVKVEVLSNSVDTSTAGTYEVTYKVTDSQGASATKTISVVVNPKMEKLNEVPSISANDKTLTVGDTFDPLDGVLANDKEDGELTAKVKVLSNNVDTSTAGTYEVTYKVTDSQGASATKTISVVVNPKMEKLNEVPSISASDKTLTVGDTFDPLDGVSASDKEDGELTAKVKVLSNNVDTSKAGIYEVTYKVTDSQGASATKTISVTVKEKENTDKPDNDKNTKNTGNSDKNSPSKTNSPKTGDQSSMGLYSFMTAMSAVLIAVLAVWKKKKASENR